MDFALDDDTCLHEAVESSNGFAWIDDADGVLKALLDDVVQSFHSGVFNRYDAHCWSVLPDYLCADGCKETSGYALNQPDAFSPAGYDTQSQPLHATRTLPCQSASTTWPIMSV